MSTHPPRTLVTVPATPAFTVTLDGVVPETTSGIQRGEESTDSDHGGVIPPPQQQAPAATPARCRSRPMSATRRRSRSCCRTSWRSTVTRSALAA